MSPDHERKESAVTFEPELEATDGGWDPYITALLTGKPDGTLATAHDDEDEARPVMSFSRLQRKSSRSR
ncbi:MAG: hypothetical protein L6Q83_01125 [Gammaproteobacteria bacterium]|nr:hypothetical protein [Gammaproteobacteria bacterium]